MSKQANKKVAVKLKNIRNNKEWYYKDIHQMTLSDKQMARLHNGIKMTEQKNQWGYTPTQQDKAIEDFERKYPKGKRKSNEA